MLVQLCVKSLYVYIRRYYKMNTEVYDKQIIEIDMANAVKTNMIDGTDYFCEFYIDILEPIRNAVYIKIMRTSIALNTNFANISLDDATLLPFTKIIFNGDDNQLVLDNDPIYVRMNNYGRLSSIINETYQEMVVIDYEKKADNPNEYQTDSSGNKIPIKEERTVTKPTVCEFFDMIHLNLTNIYNLFKQHNAAVSISPTSIAFKNENQQTAFDPNDTSVYILNPMEPSLKRFNIELRDKKNQLLNTADVSSFKMTICVYSKQKKF